MKQAEVFMKLVENAFNYSVLGRLGFDTMAALVSRLEGFTAEYGVLDDIIATLNEWVSEGGK